MPCDDVAALQLASGAGKFMVVEGQVMHSMSWHSRPLRCEVSDVGHAVFDGADALMLGSATSTAANPVQVSPSAHTSLIITLPTLSQALGRQHVSSQALHMNCLAAWQV